jgi:hypothetical protein
MMPGGVATPARPEPINRRKLVRPRAGAEARAPRGNANSALPSTRETGGSEALASAYTSDRAFKLGGVPIGLSRVRIGLGW